MGVPHIERDLAEVDRERTFSDQPYLVHRYKVDSVHYVSPTDDNRYQTSKMQAHGIYSDVNAEVGQIIVADVHHERIEELLAEDPEALGRLIRKED